MYKTKILVLGGLLACISSLFQILPVFLSEAFVILTIFSAIPIYIICRIHPKAGIIAAIASFILISFFSTHEALFFIFTNCPVGASLGCCNHFVNNKQIIISISSIILTCTLSILNFIISIPIFGTQIPGNLAVQILIIFIFSFVYNLIYLYFSKFIFKKLTKFII